MILSQWALSNAVNEIRGAESTLTSIVTQLHASGVWTGADAARFQNEWNSLVSARLTAAANRLDNCTFLTFP